ncbi:virulence factor [Paenibacillus sp. N1-5-1-14]|uniref:virulence factor n=1 Tax=Paenibacillus radicibacter TaxID=2972488 RepID=UPI002158A368|nr:virulence factor [Paenibacillus radicibacter]MCR8643196.1 virulence factor [Paenibacillus radicibacter]
MKIISIEPTPSPNSMKLTMDQSQPASVRLTYDQTNVSKAPEYVQQLLQIPDVKSVFLAADFIALDRKPKGDWQQILAATREVFGSTGQGAAQQESVASDDPWGEVHVFLQKFRGIPLQVRVRAGNEEVRAAMPQRFTDAAMKATAASPSLLKERHLDEFGIRYGELNEVLETIVQEVDASYDDETLHLLTEQATQSVAAYTALPEDSKVIKRKLTLEEIQIQLQADDWKKRYAALDAIEPSSETMPILVQLLQDDQTSVRRLAMVLLSQIKDPAVLPHLYQMLQDRSPVLRRTAGDSLSDIGDPAATPAMIKALQDDNKLVRWRAARFLYEVGDATAVEALRQAAEDDEFEVRMQANIALERIESGQEAEGTVWQQMTRRQNS